MSVTQAICGASSTVVCVYPPGHEGLCSYHPSELEMWVRKYDTAVLNAGKAVGDLNAECDQYQAKLTEVWAEVALLRHAAEKLQAYADAHPCDHMPACRN